MPKVPSGSQGRHQLFKISPCKTSVTLISKQFGCFLICLPNYPTTEFLVNLIELTAFTLLLINLLRFPINNIGCERQALGASPAPCNSREYDGSSQDGDMFLTVRV